MADSESITVNIAGKAYPLKVSSEEVAGIEKAESVINSKIEAIQTNYGVKDKQDLLAMSLLQLVVEKNTGNSKEDESIYEKLLELETFVSGFLSKKK